jgi:hypothetical protein
MQIIVGKENAEKLKERYTLLELETFQNGQTAYCVLENFVISDITQYLDLHQNMINALNRNENKFVLDSIEFLRGQFRGELDSFYDHIQEKLNGEQQT